MSDEVLSVCNLSYCPDDLLLDSGASHHMCSHRGWFSSYQTINGGSVFMGNNNPCKIVGIGSIKMKMFDGIVRTLTEVRHVPDLKRNLISLGELDSSGCKFTGQGGALKVSKGALVVMKEKINGNLYTLQGKVEMSQAVVASKIVEDPTRLWHQRLGHMSEKGLKVLMTRKLLPDLKTLDLEFCKHCVFGKQCRLKFKVGSHTSKGILDYIHSDVWGPAPTISFGGSLYFVSFIDDYSRKVWVYLLKRKSEVFSMFMQFKASVEKSTGRSIKCLRTDNGGEFTSLEFENYCKEVGIERHKTTTYTPQQNGVVERMNRTLLERARCMLSNANVEQGLWGEALLTACYLVNHSPSTAIDCKTTEEVWTGHPCDYSNLKNFGCDAYALINKKERSKLDPRSKRCIFVGYGEKNGVKGYRLWDPTAHKLTISRDVVFDESPFLKPEIVEIDMKQEFEPAHQLVKIETPPSAEVKKEDIFYDEDDEDT